MKLHSSPKIFNNYKSDYPENTVKKINDGFKKFGFEITYDEGFIYSSDFSLHSGYAYIDILGCGQEGKGTSKILSKASAYAELAERFSAGIMELKIPLPKKTGRYINILKPVNERRFIKGYEKNSNHPCTDFNFINRFYNNNLTKKQYKMFKNEGLLDSIVDVYSLLEDKYVKLPINAVELTSTSNGVAAGNTIEEAISQASFELFERYAANKIVGEKIKCRTIKPESINNKDIHKCLDLFKSLNIEVIIKDFTLGNKIPVIGVLFINNNLKDDKNKMKTSRYLMRLDVGCHLNLNEAIMRCFTEIKQSYGFNIDEIVNRKKDDVLYNIWTKELKKTYNGVKNVFKYFLTHYDYYGDLSFLKSGDTISIDELKSADNKDFLEDINNIIEICRSNKWDIYIVDYTHKVINFPTVRVIIPSVSTDFDRYTRETIKQDNIEKRVNYFFDIENFYNYLISDKWLKDKIKIRKLINDIEEYLSRELDYYLFKLNREDNYIQILNLFYILPFLYATIDDYNSAIKYFEVLKKIDSSLIVNHSFYKSLFLTKYNPKFYDAYIKILSKNLENKTSFNFELKTNPFDPETITDEIEDMYVLLLKNIKDSYFN